MHTWSQTGSVRQGWQAALRGMWQEDPIPDFENQLVFGWSFFISVHLCSLTSSAPWHASLPNSPKSPMKTVGMHIRSASSTYAWLMNLKRAMHSQNSPKCNLKDIRRSDMKPVSCWRSKCWVRYIAKHASPNSCSHSKCRRLAWMFWHTCHWWMASHSLWLPKYQLS